MDETLSYGLISLSTVMFGFQFFFSDMFRRNYGNSFRDALVSRLGGGLFGIVVLLIIKGFVFEYSNYALIMSLVVNANGFLLSYCSLKSLGKINLSLYSLFMMLGGMVVPFVSGILLHGEALTLGKLICFVIITVALFIGKGKADKNSGAIYYIGIFILNGMSGVISKLYHALPYEKISSAGYSILSASISIVITSIILLFIKGEKKKLNLKCIISMAGHGTLNKVANWFLLEALLVLPASAQYPFVTGGTMVVSTVISLFTDKKPSKREILAVVLAFIGILLLALLPEVQILKFDRRI